MDYLKSYIPQILIGVVLTILPILYFVLSQVSWYPLNPHEHLIQNGLAYLFLVVFSFINHTLFVPRWFLHKHYWRYFLVTVCCLISVAFFSYRIEQWVFLKTPPQNTVSAWMSQLFLAENLFSRPPAFAHHHHPHDVTGDAHRPEPTGPEFRPEENNFPTSGQQAPFLVGPPTGLMGKLTIIFLLGSVSCLLSIMVQTASRLRQVETDQLQAELLQLKAQIQPHFLFNTLNSIYGLAIRKDDRTADTIVKLSEFMRYIIRDAHQDRVLLATEINYIANYLDLQQARLQDAVQIDYRVQGEPNGLRIAPLLLFAFIENAFKYGVNPDEDSFISIQIKIKAEQLRLYVANNKVSVNSLERSTGIGLRNTKERLKLLYADAHQLTIEDTPTHYRVDLLLMLA